jgi:hypothetical protein
MKSYIITYIFGWTIPNIPTASHCQPIVPRIHHVTWLDKTRTRFRFHHFISVLSVLKFVRPEKIMFWHTIVPEGEYWEEYMKNISASPGVTLEMKKIEAPTEIYGKKIKVVEHQTDIVRLEAVMKYGGVYSDLDVVWLKPIDDLLCYSTTMGEELPGYLGN